MGRMSTDDAAPVRCTVFVRGLVQGVGFRWWTRARALELGLAGWARNTADGRVEVVVEGPRATVDRLLAMLGEDPSSAGRPGYVASVSAPLWAEPKGESDFRER
jgi:acylphosphatase